MGMACSDELHAVGYADIPKAKSAASMLVSGVW